MQTKSLNFYEILTPGYIFIKRGDTPRFSPRASASMFRGVLKFDNYSRNYRVYDPFCGNGTNLLTMQLLFSDYISFLYGSDVSPSVVSAANTNMNTLNLHPPFGGMQKKIEELIQMLGVTENQKINARIGCAQKLRDYLSALGPWLSTRFLNQMCLTLQ